MTATPPPAAAEAARLRQLAAAAAGAPDGKLLQLVATLDRLPDRGAADEVLRAARGRLRALRPRRPLTFARLLFAPLDGLVVEPRLWRPGGAAAPQVPRSAIRPLAEAVRAADPALAEAIDAEIRGRHTHEHAAIGAAGERLWPAAAEALPDRPPPGWARAGLPDAALAPLRALCAAVLRNGPEVWALRLAGEDGPPEEAARALLAPVAAQDPGALDAVLAALIPFCDRPAQLALAAGAMGPAQAAAAGAALDRYLAAAEPGVAGAGSLEEAAHAAERFATVLDDIGAATGPEAKERLRRLHALRRETATACRRELGAAADERLVAPLAAAAGAGADLADAEVEALEETGRAVRTLADTARRLDGAPVSAPAIDSALALLHRVVEERRPAEAADGTAGFGAVDALRMIEILAGPEAARAAAARARGF